MDEVKGRIRKWLLIAIGLLTLGIIYVIWIKATNIYLPCMFKVITKLDCPGCGISHMLMSIIHGDWQGAWQANAFLFITLPLLAYIIISYIYMDIRYGKAKESTTLKIITISYIVLLMGFGFLRNLM